MERFISNNLTNANVMTCMFVAKQYELQLLTSTTKEFIVKLVHRKLKS